jgi:septal ring factor EnvC (AmiA/AmiB activator)
MAQQSAPTGQPPKGRLSTVVLALVALALLAILGVYASIPVRERPANAPPANETAQALRDLQASQQRTADQLKALQQMVSSDQAEIRRLSDEVTALSSKPSSNPLQVFSVLPGQFSRLNPRSRKRGAR